MPLPIDQDKDVAIGLTLPLRGGNNGYFEQSYTTMEQVKSNLINLLLTIPGERYMQPTFGSNLYSHLFEQFDEFVSEQIEVTYNASGEISEGDPTQVTTVTDIWTFARNTRSRNPNWTLVATEAPN